MTVLKIVTLVEETSKILEESDYHDNVLKVNKAIIAPTCNNGATILGKDLAVKVTIHKTVAHTKSTAQNHGPPPRGRDLCDKTQMGTCLSMLTAKTAETRVWT